MSYPPYFGYWGKARPDAEIGPLFHLLVFHCLDVTAVGEVLLKKAPLWRRCLAWVFDTSEENAMQWALVFLALHDLGKFSPVFQNMVPEHWKGLQNGNPRLVHYRPIHHSDLGFLLWQKKLGKYMARTFAPDDLADAKSWFSPFMAAATCHHGQPPQSIKLKINHYFPTEDQDAAGTFTQKILNLFQPKFYEKFLDTAIIDDHKPGSYWLAGFIILCDWLGSNQTYFPYQDQPDDLDNYYLAAIGKAERAVEETAVVPPPTQSQTGLCKLFPGYSPTPLQALAEKQQIAPDAGPHFFIVEELTGAGKTEAALVLAQRLMASDLASGIYFALPTMATSDQMYDRLAAAYHHLYQDQNGTKPSLVLAHGSRDLHHGFTTSLGIENPAGEDSLAAAGTTELRDNASAWCARWLSDNRKKALLGAVGVGTVDQAMLAVLPAKHATLRLWGLAGKVLILDEIHAYDTYMLEILQKLIHFHTASGGSTILLSATLSLKMRKNLINSFFKAQNKRPPELSDEAAHFPLMMHAHTGGNLAPLPFHARSPKTLRFALTDMLPMQWIQNHTENGACVCWIRNTVKDARDAYIQLVQALGADNVTLFHARFALGHRLHIQDALLHRFGKKGTGQKRQGHVVIATQVIEQSLDLDFDEMVTDLAPIDLLLQRAGRLRRHARDTDGNYDPNGQIPDHRGIPELLIYAPPWTENPNGKWYENRFKEANNVYQHTACLWLTMRTIREHPEIRLPSQSRALIESVYGDVDLPAGLDESDKNHFTQETVKRDKSKSILLSLNDGYAEGNLWQDPDDIATRLSIATRNLRLAVWQHDHLIPLFQHLKKTHLLPPPENNRWQDDEIAWQLSEAKAYHYQLTRIDELTKEIQDAAKVLCESMPDRNAGVTFIVLTIRDDGRYHATGIKGGEDQPGKPVTIIYNPRTGLDIQETN